MVIKIIELRASMAKFLTSGHDQIGKIILFSVYDNN